MLAKLNYETHVVMGEHDYYLDLGEYWSKLYGPHYYSWDHKGVHFVVLNSILTYEDWINKWPTPKERMGVMAGLDNPNGSPFMVGEKQMKWLQKDLKKVAKDSESTVNNLLGNCAVQLFLRNPDDDTNKYASGLFGEKIWRCAET